MVQCSPSARQQWKALILENDFVWFHSFIHPSIMVTTAIVMMMLVSTVLLKQGGILHCTYDLAILTQKPLRDCDANLNEF